MVHCRAKEEEQPRAFDADDARHIRVESGVEPVEDLSRLYSLYLPEASIVANDTRGVGTRADGRANLRIARQPHECIDLVISSAEDTPHTLVLAAFEGGGSAHGARRTLPPDEQLLGYDTGHATAWIIPQLCDGSGTPIDLYIQGLADTRYQIQVHRRKSTPVDRALYAQARRDLPGFRAYGPLQHDTLMNNERRSMPLAVSGDHCIAIAAHAAEGLEDLDAQLLDLHGDRLALEVATDASSIVGPYCPRKDEIIRVEFRAYAGQGSFQWQRWESEKSVGARLLDARQRAKDGRIDDALHATLRREVLRAFKDPAPAR